MGISVDGNNITFEGTVSVVNGFNPDTGVAYLVLSPTGGVGTLPFLSTGDPGLPPVFDSITVEEVDPDDPLPTPNPVVTLVSPGGAGVASHYNLLFYIHSGATGDTGAIVISDATDLSDTPDSSHDGYIMVYDHDTTTWVLSAQKVGNLYVPASLTSKASNNTTTHTIGSVAVPAQPFDWRPICHGSAIISGTANTRVDVLCRVDNATSGDEVAYSFGIAGATPPPNVLVAAPAPGVSVPGSYGRVSAGNGATIYFRAEQKAATSDSWSLNNSTARFGVEVLPLL